MNAPEQKPVKVYVAVNADFRDDGIIMYLNDYDET